MNATYIAPDTFNWTRALPETLAVIEMALDLLDSQPTENVVNAGTLAQTEVN